jgi:serine/threonine protein phosphatase PrpC
VKMADDGAGGDAPQSSFAPRLATLGPQWRARIAGDLAGTSSAMMNPNPGGQNKDTAEGPGTHTASDSSLGEDSLASCVASTGEKAVLWLFFPSAVRRAARAASDRSSKQQKTEEADKQFSSPSTPRRARVSPGMFTPSELVTGCVAAMEVACDALLLLTNDQPQGKGSDASQLRSSDPGPLARSSTRVEMALLLTESVATSWLLAHESAFGDIEAALEPLLLSGGNPEAESGESEWSAFVDGACHRWTTPVVFLICVLAGVPLPPNVLGALEQRAERACSTNTLREDLDNRMRSPSKKSPRKRKTTTAVSTTAGDGGAAPSLPMGTASATTLVLSPAPQQRTSVTASPRLGHKQGLAVHSASFGPALRSVLLSPPAAPLNVSVELDIDLGLDDDDDEETFLFDGPAPPLDSSLAQASFSPSRQFRMPPRSLKTSQSFAALDTDADRWSSVMANMGQISKEGWLEKGRASEGGVALPTLQFHRVWATLDADRYGAPTFAWFHDVPENADDSPIGWIPLEVLYSVQIGCERERLERRHKRRSLSSAHLPGTTQAEAGGPVSSSSRQPTPPVDRRLSGNSAHLFDGGEPGFTLLAGGHRFLFRCPTAEEARAWVFAFQCHSASKLASIMEDRVAARQALTSSASNELHQRQQRRLRILQTAQWWKKYDELVAHERLSSSQEERVWNSVISSSADFPVGKSDQPGFFGVARASSQGHRAKMEDADDVRIFDCSNEDPCLFVGVFDGHGGDEASTFSARHLWPLIETQFQSRGLLPNSTAQAQESAERGSWARHAELKQALITAHRQVDRKFLGEASAREWYSGTTACSAIISREFVAVANVGDSRAVLCRRKCGCVACTGAREGESAPDTTRESRAVEAHLGLRGMSLRTSNGGFSELTVEPLSRDHRPPATIPGERTTEELLSSPECDDERVRITRAGGWFADREELDWAGVYRANPAILDVLHEDDPLPESVSSLTRKVVVPRLLGELSVTRALGDIEYKLPHSNEYWDAADGAPFAGDLVSAEPDVVVVARRGTGSIPEDSGSASSAQTCSAFTAEFLIIACDGLWDVMSSAEACRFVHTASAWQSPERVARALVDHALTLGSMDNISAVVVFLRPLGGDGGSDGSAEDEFGFARPRSLDFSQLDHSDEEGMQFPTSPL